MNKYLYPIYKSNLKPWIKYWLIKKTSVKPVSGTYTRATGASPLTITKALKAPIRDLNLYGDCKQYQGLGDNLYKGYANLTSGWLPNNGAYPTTNASYPNARYQLIELNEGDSITISNSTTTRARIRYINIEQDLVIGTVSTSSNVYFTSTADFDSRITNGTITAKRDFILGILVFEDRPDTENVMLNSGSEALPYEPYGYKPSPTNPSEVQTITGNVGLQVTQGLNISYRPIRLGSIELCKIGDYQDRIFKAPDNKWYLEKNIGKVVLNGSENENWSLNAAAPSETTKYFQSNVIDGTKMASTTGLCNRFLVTAEGIWTDNGEKIQLHNSGDNIRMRINTSLASTVSELQTWLETHNVTLYYVLASAVVTEITGVNLLNDLEAASSIETFKGSNEVAFSDLNPNISFDYLKEDEV